MDIGQKSFWGVYLQYLGSILLFFCAALAIVPAFFFFFNQPITPIYFWIAIILAFALASYGNAGQDFLFRTSKLMMLGILGFGLVLVVTVFVSIFFFDLSMMGGIITYLL